MSGRFLEDCVVQEPDIKTAVSDLHATYIAWARVNGGPGLFDQVAVGGAHRSRLRKPKISSMFWMGVKLVKSVNDFVDYEGKPLRENAKAGHDSDHHKGDDSDDILF